MYSIIQPPRILACKAIFNVKGERYAKQLIKKYCVVCSNNLFTNQRNPSFLFNDNAFRHSLVVINICDGKSTPFDGIKIREFHGSSSFSSEPLKPSSKVEEMVQVLKEKESDKSIENKLDGSVVKVKKTLKQRIIDECLHYYHGFRLLFIDINVSRKLLWRILQGKTLTRREHKLLVRTVGDMFRLVPFSVFIVVPFLEFTLPFFIKLFPGMLPSTFQTTSEREDKLKRSVKVNLEMAKFLQETLDELPVVNKGGHSCVSAKEFAEFFQKVRTSGGMTSSDEIMKFSKLFADEITLDSLPRPQLMALCRVLEINPIGPSNVLRFRLRLKLRSLAADDLMIEKEGIDSLSQSELQMACRARGMRALGVSEERLKAQLVQWLDLSLEKKVPPTLLLLSQAFMFPDTIPTSEKLAQTISALPDTIGTKTEAIIGEREGKIDNKAKIELIKEEVKAIKEEKKELLEEAERKAQLQHSEEELKDTAPIISDRTTQLFPELRAALDDLKRTSMSQGAEDISPKDIKAIDTALDLLGKHKNDLMVEKEELEDLRQEMSEYQEDVADLRAVAKSNEVCETKAAKRLFKKVSKIIDKVDTSLEQLDKGKAFKQSTDIRAQLQDKASDGLLKIDELLNVLHNMKLDESRLTRISQVLTKIDTDQDGVVRLDTVLKIIELVGNDNVPLNQDQLEEMIHLVNKEEAIELDEQIAKALKVKETDKSDSQIVSSNVKHAKTAVATAVAEPLSQKSPVSDPNKSPPYNVR